MNTQSAAMVAPSFPLGIVLFLIFMTLKLCGVIAWSWLWITAPLWIPVAIIVAILAVIGIIIGLAVWGEKRAEKMDEVAYAE